MATTPLQFQRQEEEATLQNARVGRRQYLVTYSQADLGKFPTRESFAKMLEEEFNAGIGKCKVAHWACAKEPHEEGGVHYHCSLKLSDVKKWLSVKNRIMKKHGIVINFSDKHNHYISAYRYVTKTDDKLVHSLGHPDLSEVGSPRTKACTSAYRLSRKRPSSAVTPRTLAYQSPQQPQPPAAGCSSSSTSSGSKRRLSNLEVADYITKNAIHSKTELFAQAEKRKNEGECDLAMFLFSRSEKSVNELICKSWLLKNAAQEISINAMSRMQHLKEALSKDCAAGCQWLQAALEVLQLNDIDVKVFASYVHDLLSNGRGKFRNLMIIGRSNCAKTFMLKPLKCVFNESLFENPSRDKFGWVGAQDAKVILLQDFRYSNQLIAWNDLLLLLEGETVKLPAPKNHFVSDILIDTDVPIFGTSRSKIEYSRYSPDYERETEMMDSRWRVVKFTYVFAENQQKKINPCGRCFAELVFMAE